MAIEMPSTAGLNTDRNHSSRLRVECVGAVRMF